MRLRKFRCPFPLIVDGQPTTASWQIGDNGCTSIEALGGGVVVIAFDAAPSLMISPSGYGVVAAEQVVKGKTK